MGSLRAEQYCKTVVLSIVYSYLFAHLFILIVCVSVQAY